MTLMAGERFTAQLSAIIAEMSEHNPVGAKSFKTYLDSILFNIPSKLSKYKPSLYIDHPDARDIEHQGCTIVFYYDRHENSCVLLGIIDHRSSKNRA